MNRFALPLLLAAACCLPGMAHAVEFRSVGAAPAILYDAPTERGRKLFIAPRGMPVEIVLANGDWTKVRDAGGDLTWVQTKDLVARRTVVATTANAKVRIAPGESSAVAFSVDKGVVMEVIEPISSGWIKVRHRDGLTGFIKAGDVWGD